MRPLAKEGQKDPEDYMGSPKFTRSKNNDKHGKDSATKEHHEEEISQGDTVLEQ